MKFLLGLLVIVHLAAPAFAAAGDLYFTECVEGSGSDKALEIRNATGAAVSLAGYQVRFYFNGSSVAGLTIGLAGSLADGDVVVLAHSGAQPALLALADLTAGGNWFNGDDAIALVKGGVLLDVIGQIGVDPGSEWGAGSASTADNTLRRKLTVAGGDPDGSNPFVPSIEWQGFPNGVFDGLGMYPDEGSVPKPLAIAQIQGAGHVSPFHDQLVETTGVVTAVADNGFYLQDPVGDGDALTSEGVFVFTASAPAVSAGNAVRVTGTVHEFQPGGASSQNLSTTELAEPTVELLAPWAPLPAPAVLGASGSLPPTELIDDDGLQLFDPASDGIDFYEPFEGLRVAVEDALAVGPRNEFGELVVVSDGGRFATGLNARSGLTLSATDGNPERIRVRLDPHFLPGFDPQVNTGDRLGDVTGVLSYAFGGYEVVATQPFRVAGADLEPETARPVPPDDHLSIAAFNLLNLDPKVESLALVGSFADIDDDVGSGRFDRLGAEIVVNLRAPDILGLEEVQDGDGAEQTALTDAALTLQTLVTAIAAAGGPAYEFRDIAPVNGTSGGQPGGNIRVALLFNPQRVALDESSLQQVLDPDPGDGDAFAHSRIPLLARFAFQGRKVTVIVNHFASKSGSTPLFGLVQPPVNGSVAQRVAQAEVVHDRVAELLVADGAANVVVLGDLNEFAFNAPLAVLEGQPAPILSNLTETLPGTEQYSYVFDGNAQALDHILVSAALAPLASYDVVHVNAEFTAQASDHDPVLARFAFPAVCQPDLGFAGPGRAQLSVCGNPLAPTGTATLALELPAGAAGILCVGLASAPVATHGGTFVPLPLFEMLPLVDADCDGVLTLPIDGGIASAPVSLVVQFIYPDARLTPFGFGFSNAVELRFEGP